MVLIVEDGFSFQNLTQSLRDGNYCVCKGVGERVGLKW